VAAVLHQAVATARREAMFERGGRALVAVSGGPDSLCLLHTLARARRLLHLSDLVVFHFDHRLRQGSAGDARYVRRQAERLGFPFMVRSATGRPGRGESVEAWARTARYEALTAVVEELGGGVAAVGHTADDQAETVLMALLRGGGLHAVAGIPPVRRPIVRPLLDVTREQTEAFCRALHLRPRRDPMNEDPAYLRAALRARVLPLLEEGLGRGVTASLVRTAALLRADAELLDRLADRAFPAIVTSELDDTLLHVAPLMGQPGPLASRVVRQALLGLGVLPEAGHVEAVLDLAQGNTGRRATLPGGLLARREREYVRLSRPSPERRSGASPSRLAGRTGGRHRGDPSR
jgi:tRNA(Ile)-lysidine synthase